VFDGISRQAQFGKHDQIGASVTGAAYELEMLPDILLHIPQDAVYLGKREREFHAGRSVAGDGITSLKNSCIAQDSNAKGMKPRYPRRGISKSFGPAREMGTEYVHFARAQ